MCFQYVINVLRIILFNVDEKKVVNFWPTWINLVFHAWQEDGRDRPWEITPTQSVKWEKDTEENRMKLLLLLFIYFKFMKFFCFFGKPNVRKTNFFCEVSKNKNVTASKFFLWLLFWTETNKEHRPRGMSDLLPRLRFLVVLLASPRRRDDRSTLNFFQLDFYPSSASLIFSSSVPDRVWKSKFLYPFSFSFCESFS